MGNSSASVIPGLPNTGFRNRNSGFASSGRLVLASLVAAVILLSLPAAKAQLSSAAVNGTVRDSSGAVIQEAQITLRKLSTGEVRATKTNSAGDYAFIDVAPGNYALEVTKAGFATAQQNSLALYVNQTATFNFSLKVGAQVQQVRVEAASSQMETSTANLGTVINGSAMNALPLNGRNFTQLLTLAPGASRANPAQNSGGNDAILTGSFSFPSINGQMNRSNLFLLDGINDLQLQFSEYAVPPIADAIDEFKVQSHNDQSQFGGVLGGIVNVVTKSGANQFHGDAWEFLRNDAFDARDPLLTSKTPLKESVYGVTIGGPAIVPHYNGRNHTFFFGAYEGTNINSASQLLYNVPTAAELAGNFSAITQKLYNPYTTTPDPNIKGDYLRTPFPGNNISSAIDPNMLTLAENIFPAPIAPVSGFNGEDVTPDQTRQNNYSLRLDHRINESNSLWGRLSQFHANLTESGGFKGLLETSVNDGQNWAVSYLHTFGASATLQVEAGHVWQYYTESTEFPNAPANLVAASGYDTAFGCGFVGPTPCMIPEMGIGGYASGGDSYLAHTDSDIYEWRADFAKLIGHHTFQVGLDVNKVGEHLETANDSVTFSAFQTEDLEKAAGTGNTLASFLIGAPTSAERRNNIKVPRDGWVNGVYVGDQWKVLPKLTMNVGLRYDWVIMPVLAANSSQSNITGALNLRNGTYILTKASAGLGSCATLNAAPCIPGGVLPADVVVGNSNSLIDNQVDNIQPRLGLAYQLDRQRVIHLSYARVYDVWSGVGQGVQNEGALWPSFGLDNVTNLNATTVTATAENPLNLPAGANATLPAATPFTQGAVYVAPYLKNPYSDQWTVGFQQQVGAAAVLTVNYVGSRSTHLPCCDFFNVAVTPGPGTPQSRAPFPYITQTEYEQSNGSGTYDGLQIQLDRKMSSGLAYTINYTWSKTIDVACDGYFGAEGCFIRNPYNPKADRSVAGFDLPQMVTGDVTYLLPFGAGQRLQTGSRFTDAVLGGWELNSVVTLTSGNPYTVSYSGDEANTGNKFQGVDLVGNPKLAKPTIQEWFNTAAFQAPAQYTYGDVGRNTLRSDSYKNVDLSVFRKFAIERAQVEFRLEAFNAFNMTSLGTPSATLNTTTFGQVNSTASTQRELQLALKIYF